MKTIVAVAFILMSGIANATNYFSWNADSTTYSIMGSNKTGAMHGDSVFNCTVKHGGTCSMEIPVIGDDGRNNGQGFDLSDSVDGYTYYPFNIVGGPSIYYRWWMRIEPGFSWGYDNASTKGSRVFGANPYPRGYTGGLHADGIYISECDDVGSPAGGGCGTTNDAANVSYNFRAKNDGQWHEYIVRVKPNSTTSANDAELQLWVDGVSVGQQNNWRLNTHAGNGMIEAWGGWMVYPYFQLGGTASDGGTMYLDDFSTDNTYNSIYGGGDTTPPTGVALTAPSNGATISGAVTVSSTCSDETSIRGVQFKYDSTNIGSEDTSSPYSVSWDTTAVTNGTYSLTAVCTDNGGNSTTSPARSVTVSNAAPVLSNLLPTSNLVRTATSATLQATTDQTATCRYALGSGTPYAGMTPFTNTANTAHSSSVSVVAGGVYQYCVRCMGTSLVSDESCTRFAVDPNPKKRVLH